MATIKKIEMQVFNGTDYDTLYPKVILTNTTGTLPVSSGGTGNNSVDTTPTSGSTKMCTSGGIYTAINELKTSVSNGKSTIASAITDMGVSTSATATFQTMANNIKNIYNGYKVCTTTWTWNSTDKKMMLPNDVIGKNIVYAYCQYNTSSPDHHILCYNSSWYLMISDKNTLTYNSTEGSLKTSIHYYSNYTFGYCFVIYN